MTTYLAEMITNYICTKKKELSSEINCDVPNNYRDEFESRIKIFGGFLKRYR